MSINKAQYMIWIIMAMLYNDNEKRRSWSKTSKRNANETLKIGTLHKFLPLHVVGTMFIILSSELTLNYEVTDSPTLR